MKSQRDLSLPEGSSLTYGNKLDLKALGTSSAVKVAWRVRPDMFFFCAHVTWLHGACPNLRCRLESEGSKGDCPHAAAPGGSGVWISELGRGQDRALDLSCPLKMELSRPDKAASFV